MSAPVTAASRPRTVTIEVNGRQVSVVEGVSLAAALVGDRTWTFRRNPVSEEPRGPFCGMGVCLECEVTVDGRPGVRACLTPVRPGMRVRTAGAGEGP
ncbi:(2Fe-2S)-binding protein [Nonomuraea sp. CA-218870]|uniref:(2Fe-2S)-binding protein n=1 Tax=Nonomuraea sp. CA-218870 TaxID=3239998 RepID=UPI003D919CE4